MKCLRNNVVSKVTLRIMLFVVLFNIEIENPHRMIVFNFFNKNSTPLLSLFLSFQAKETIENIRLKEKRLISDIMTATTSSLVMKRNPGR